MFARWQRQRVLQLPLNLSGERVCAWPRWSRKTTCEHFPSKSDYHFTTRFVYPKFIDYPSEWFKILWRDCWHKNDPMLRAHIEREVYKSTAKVRRQGLRRVVIT